MCRCSYIPLLAKRSTLTAEDETAAQAAATSLLVLVLLGPLCFTIVFALAAARDAFIVPSRYAARSRWNAACAEVDAAWDEVELVPVAV